jgi:tetratricopeptide (TPR) repeat protein
MDPQNGIALNNLSLLLSQIGRFAEAESLATAGIASAGGIGNMYLQLINSETGANHLDAARRTLEAYGRVEPNAPSYLRARALYFTAAGQRDSAERAYADMGLRVRNPTYQRFSHGGLSLLALSHGRLAESEKQRQAWIAAADEDTLPGDVLIGEAGRAATLALFQRDTAGALRVLQAALEKHPLASMPALDRPYSELAYSYALAGRTAEAKRLLSEYESAVPAGIRQGDPTWYRARGWVALAEKRPKDAIPEFQAIGPKGQRAEWGHWDLGVAFERAGQPDSAVAQYELAAAPGGSGLKVIQENAWALAPSYKRLGELYEERGDKARASEYYGRFVDLWKDADPVLQPEVRQARQRMGELAGEGGGKTAAR